MSDKVSFSRVPCETGRSRILAAGFVLASLTGVGAATALQADQPIVRLFDMVAGNADLLDGILPTDVIATVEAGAPAPGLDFKVLLATPELGLDRRWAIAQLITDQTCNAQGECEIHIRHSTPNGWVTSVEVMAVDVTFIEDGSEPVSLLFSGMQGPVIWRWNGENYAFDEIADDTLLDAYYAATGGDNF